MTGTALVTGASSGLGADFARRLGARGHGVILVARRVDRLSALADELRARHPGQTFDVVESDLGAADAVAKLLGELDARALRPDLLVNNAGFGSVAPVVDADPGLLRAMVALNCGVVAELSAVFARRFVEAGRGGILNVASTASFQPVATQACYGATKAFVLSFTEALWAELRGTGVRVMALCPGGVTTEFFDVAGETGGAHDHRMSSTEVVSYALDRFEDGRSPSVVPGLRNRLLSLGYRVLPRRAIAAGSARFARNV